MAGHNKKQRSPKSAPGRLRIVAGKWRGRVLRVADVPGLRPTAQRTRETLFNWLAPVIGGAHCLDLYAGSGALGLEALSRGAAAAVFVERAKPAIKGLAEAIETLGADGATIVAADALDFLRAPPPQQFDVVFLDPPYADESTGELCRLLVEGQWLAPGAYVYFEQDRRLPPADLPPGLVELKQKNAGQVRYCLAQVETRPAGQA